ncbi:hypothetical protein P029_02980 [Anaplasma phagocytophilum str. Norway variant2]|uniref:Uncharacterized protein n=1 Tax=Anaplasma phagocytophilum str. Norway variant2 TaxID=1392507 RepID=A0A168HC54_ANAPH|nr:hypothetical protein [Anaplasma phagocytophilum]ANC34321.1 hypothetical protein P029_02980 [Anaplasma phagocytophilum str. Norway variant2]
MGFEKSMGDEVGKRLVSGKARTNIGREFASWVESTGYTRSRNTLGILIVSTMSIGCAFLYYASRAETSVRAIVFSIYAGIFLSVSAAFLVGLSIVLQDKGGLKEIERLNEKVKSGDIAFIAIVEEKTNASHTILQKEKVEESSWEMEDDSDVDEMTYTSGDEWRAKFCFASDRLDEFIEHANNSPEKNLALYTYPLAKGMELVKSGFLSEEDMHTPSPFKGALQSRLKIDLMDRGQLLRIILGEYDSVLGFKKDGCTFGFYLDYHLNRLEKRIYSLGFIGKGGRSCRVETDDEVHLRELRRLFGETGLLKDFDENRAYFENMRECSNLAKSHVGLIDYLINNIPENSTSGLSGTSVDALRSVCALSRYGNLFLEETSNDKSGSWFPKKIQEKNELSYGDARRVNTLQSPFVRLMTAKFALDRGFRCALLSSIFCAINISEEGHFTLDTDNVAYLCRFVPWLMQTMKIFVEAANFRGSSIGLRGEEAVHANLSRVKCFKEAVSYADEGVLETLQSYVDERIMRDRKNPFIAQDPGAYIFLEYQALWRAAKNEEYSLRSFRKDSVRRSADDLEIALCLLGKEHEINESRVAWFMQEFTASLVASELLTVERRMRCRFNEKMDYSIDGLIKFVKSGSIQPDYTERLIAWSLDGIWKEDREWKSRALFSDALKRECIIDDYVPSGKIKVDIKGLQSGAEVVKGDSLKRALQIISLGEGSDSSSSLSTKGITEEHEKHEEDLGLLTRQSIIDQEEREKAQDGVFQPLQGSTCISSVMQDMGALFGESFLLGLCIKHCRRVVERYIERGFTLQEAIVKTGFLYDLHTHRVKWEQIRQSGDLDCDDKKWIENALEALDQGKYGGQSPLLCSDSIPNIDIRNNILGVHAVFATSLVDKVMAEVMKALPIKESVIHFLISPTFCELLMISILGRNTSLAAVKYSNDVGLYEYMDAHVVDALCTYMETLFPYKCAENNTVKRIAIDPRRKIIIQTALGMTLRNTIDSIELNPHNKSIIEINKMTEGEDSDLFRILTFLKVEMSGGEVSEILSSYKQCSSVGLCKERLSELIDKLIMDKEGESGLLYDAVMYAMGLSLGRAIQREKIKTVDEFCRYTDGIDKVMVDYCMLDGEEGAFFKLLANSMVFNGNNFLYSEKKSQDDVILGIFRNERYENATSGENPQSSLSLQDSIGLQGKYRQV